MRDSVKFRQQFDPVFPSDQNALQGLAILQHLLTSTQLTSAHGLDLTDM